MSPALRADRLTVCLACLITMLMGCGDYGMSLLRSTVKMPARVQGQLNINLGPLHAVVGRELCVYFDTTVQWDTTPGAASVGEVTFQVRLRGAVRGVQSTSADRWSFTPVPSDVGVRRLRLRVLIDGAVAGEVYTTLSVSPLVKTGSLSVASLGDSITNAGTWIDELEDLLPAGWTTVGTLGPTAEGNRHDGYSGSHWERMRLQYGDSPQPGVPDSPLVYGAAGRLDLEHYVTTAGGRPDVCVWLLGTNRMFTGGLARLDGEMGHAEQVLSEWRRVYPAVRHVMVLTLPGSSDETKFVADYDGALEDQYRWEQIHRGLYAEMVSRFSGRELTDGIYLADAATAIDPATQYANALHPNASGHSAIAGAVYAALAKMVHTKNKTAYENLERQRRAHCTLARRQ